MRSSRHVLPAGAFSSGTAAGEVLRRMSRKAGNSLGIVSPHAGYIYSGQVAATAFGTISPDFSGTFVVIGPSHRGYINCVSEVPWETPLGVVDTDDEFVELLDIETDELSHRDEHSLEVQMPFIKYRFPRARIAPVMMGQQDYASAMRLAEKIGPRSGRRNGMSGSSRPATFRIMCRKKRQNRMTSGRSNRYQRSTQESSTGGSRNGG